MPKVKSIFLGLVLALPFIGAFGWFTGRLVLVRHEAATRLSSDRHGGTLIRLSFARGDVPDLLEWEHSREFRYRGEMYDVARTDETADSVSYWCYLDMKETSLRREISKWLARALGRGDAGTPAPVRQLAHFFSNLFPPSPVDPFEDIHLSRQCRPGDFLPQWVDDMTIRPPAPPPWTC